MERTYLVPVWRNRAPQNLRFVKSARVLLDSRIGRLSLRINLLHRGEALRVSHIGGKCSVARRAILDACVVQVAQRSSAGGSPSVVTKSPGLIHAAAHVPKIVGVAQPKGMKLAGDGDLCVRTQNQRPVR